MSKNAKISLGIVLVAIAIVSVYFIFLAPRSISVKIELPTGLSKEPELVIESSKSKYEISNFNEAFNLKVNRSGDTVNISSINGKLLEKKELGKNSKEISFEFKQPSIEDFSFSLDKENGILNLFWKAESDSYEIRKITLERNGSALVTNNDTYSESFLDYQGTTLLYKLTIEYYSEPFSIIKSKDVEVSIPQLPVSIKGTVAALKPLDTKLISVCLDNSAATVLSEEFFFDNLQIGKHNLEVLYDGVPIIEKDLNLEWKETPFEYAYYLYPLILRNIQMKKDGEGLRLSWNCELKGNSSELVSFQIEEHGEVFSTEEESYYFDLPEKDEIINVVPLYKGVKYGRAIQKQVEGRPIIEIEEIPEFITEKQLDLSFVTENMFSLRVYLDGNEISSFLEPEGEKLVKLGLLDEGQHNLVLEGTGYYGREANKSFKFIVDTVSPNEPVVKSVSPSEDEIVLKFDLPAEIEYIEYKIDFRNGETLSGTTTSNELHISPTSNDFKGRLFIETYAKDLAGNKSNWFKQDLEIVNFTDFFNYITAGIDQLDSGELVFFVENNNEKTGLSLELELVSVNGNRKFEYDLDKTRELKEIIMEDFLGEVALSGVLKIAGAVSDPIILARKTFKGSLDNFKVYQTDGSGAYRIEFDNPFDSSVLYEIHGMDKVKTVSANDFPAGKIIVDFESPLSSNTSESTRINIQVVAKLGNYEESFSYDGFSVFAGATVLSGEIKDQDILIDETDFPILIAGDLVISDNASIKISGDGLLIIQENATLNINGKLEINGANKMEVIGKKNSRIILEKGYLEGKNLIFSGHDLSIRGSDSHVEFSDTVFSGLRVPINLTAKSKLYIYNSVFNSAESAVTLDSPEEVEIEGLAIENSSKGIIIDNATGKTSIKNVEMKNNTSINCIKVTGNYEGTLEISDSDISTPNNGIEIVKFMNPSIENTILNGSKTALIISDCIDTMIKSILITGDYINGDSGTGILISNSSAEIQDSEISFCDNYGIYISNVELPAMAINNASSSNPVLLKNLHFKNNPGYDIFVTGSYNVTAPGMKIDDIKTYDARISEYWADGNMNKPRGLIMVQ